MNENQESSEKKPKISEDGVENDGVILKCINDDDDKCTSTSENEQTDEKSHGNPSKHENLEGKESNIEILGTENDSPIEESTRSENNENVPVKSMTEQSATKDEATNDLKNAKKVDLECSEQMECIESNLVTDDSYLAASITATDINLQPQTDKSSEPTNETESLEKNKGKDNEQQLERIPMELDDFKISDNPKIAKEAIENENIDNANTLSCETDNSDEISDKIISEPLVTVIACRPSIRVKSYSDLFMSKNSPEKPKSDVRSTGEDESSAVIRSNEATTSISDINLNKTECKIESKKIETLMDCINNDCLVRGDNLIVAPEFVISYYNVSKKSKRYFVCERCFDLAIESYSELCASLEDGIPLFASIDSCQSDLVEILDSDDDEPEIIKEAQNPLNTDIISMIENELENLLKENFNRVNIDQQIDQNKDYLDRKITKNLNESKDLLKTMDNMQISIDKMYAEVHSFRITHTEEEVALDLDKTHFMNLADDTYPPNGPIEHPTELKVNDLFYVIKTILTSSWAPAYLLDTIDSDIYTIKYLKSSKRSQTIITEKKVKRKEMAYGKPPKYRLNVGTRIIAKVRNNNPFTKVERSVFYVGIIAEPLRKYNNYRYLVFFDDGYVQYVYHDEVRVVCESCENVWEDVAPVSRAFIHLYLKQFSTERPMVQVKRNVRMMVEWQDKWYNANVVNIDASLVYVYFEEIKRYEWIYRGSQRLSPLFRKMHCADGTKELNPTSSSARNIERSKRTIPTQAIRDTPQQEREKRELLHHQEEQQKHDQQQVQQDQQKQLNEPQEEQKPNDKQNEAKPTEERRSVAKKSTAQLPKPTIQHLNNSTIYVDEDTNPKGKVVFYTAKKHITPNEFMPHECGPTCLFNIPYNLRSYSPLAKPLLSGWERQICKNRIKKIVMYRGPCGRRLRNIKELYQYLRLTKCSLKVSNFDYDPMIHCLAEYVTERNHINKPDISDGMENMAIPCVNHYDNTMPPPCEYSAKRLPTPGVNLNLAGEFLCGCDCTDGCLDKTKCQCWQLTLAGAKYGNPGENIETIGYQYKRLLKQVATGIYECNMNCKCKANCLNRVVQEPLEMKLQLFKTVNRGWGLRCLNDIPRGSFVCCYAGNLLTEQDANEAGSDLGDEYFAELDYIEVVEQIKEGYEPDVINDDEDSDDDKSSEDEFDPKNESRNKDSDDEFVCRSNVCVKTRYLTRNSIDSVKSVESKSSDKKKSNDSSDDEREPINFTPSVGPDGVEEATTKRKSIRQFFGKNEAVYIMDAKKTGNIGRYFNHSCSPNLFVQNVFVDTHDLRFPWVAFFALSHIRAGTELTWNYNYDVGSVPGKFLICQCGSSNCRGRLL